MSAKAMLACMIAGTAVVILCTPRRSEPAHKPPPPRPAEVPWLSKDAAKQLVADDGSLGPLFLGVVLGGPPPAEETRSRIQAFANKHAVTIDFDVDDQELVAVRLDVTFHGGFGYEGADVFSLRLGRRSTGTCCVCGGPDTWIDDWTELLPDQTYFHGNVRVNRVLARWERTLPVPELLERANGLLGKSVARVRTAAGDRWTSRPYNASASIEVPYVVPTTLEVDTRDGRITEVSLRLTEQGDRDSPSFEQALSDQFGRPRRRRGDGHHTWLLADRTVEASVDGDLTLTMRLR